MPYQTLVGPDDVLRHPEWVLVDCRFVLQDPDWGLDEWRKSHVPGSFYAHLDEDLSAPIQSGSGRHPLPDPGSFCRTLGYWGIEDGVQVVVYDQSNGAFAARLWWMLRWLGHDAVALLDGGWERWVREGHPRSDTLELPRHADFQGSPNDDWVISSQTLQDDLAAGACCLIDVRDAPRFRGEVEPIDPVAGHVPGARNAPYREALNPHGLFLPADRLRARFIHFLDQRPVDTAVFMCGSGVNACHSLLAMEIAGLPGARLYAGSWSEWIRDPSRPIARGG